MKINTPQKKRKNKFNEEKKERDARNELHSKCISRYQMDEANWFLYL